MTTYILETAAGSAKLQKTDILKRMLWFSYPKNSEWIPIDLERVNEIIKLNKKGEKPDTLVDKPIGAEIINKYEPAPDLISDQDINRYDEIDQQRKKQNKNRRNKKGQGNRNNPRNKSRNFKGDKKKPGGQQSANRGDKPKPNPAKPQNSNSGKPNNPNKKRRRPNNPNNKPKGPKKED